MRRLVVLTLVLGILACKARRPSDEAELKDVEAKVPAKPTAELIPNDLEDLPPVGRSLFDEIFHAETAFPRKLEDVSALLTSKYGAEVEGLLIPHGRSLQKSATDMKAPRAILAASNVKLAKDCLSAHTDRLYLGFAERTDTLEIISYNDAAARFEFQLVKDFSKPTAKLLYAPRALCTSCHQGGSPIFSFPPWQETNGPAEQGEVYPELVTEEVRKHHPGAKTLYGVPVSNEEASASSYDGHVQRSSELLGASQLWTKGCGAGEPGGACRKALLTLALAGSVRGGCKFTNLKLEGPEAVAALAATRAVWPEAGIGLPNRNIEDRQPEPATRFSRAEEDPLTRRKPFVVIKATASPESEFPKEGGTYCPVFGKFAGDTSALSVATFLKGDHELFLSKAEAAAVKAAVAGAGEGWRAKLDDPALAPLFAEAPLSRRAFLSGVFRAYGKTGEADAVDACFPGAKKLPDPHLAQSAAARAVDRANGTVVGLFRSYCESCHSDTGAANLDFLKDQNDDAVWKALRANKKVLERLEAKTMPPAPSMKTVEEELDRETMIMALRTGITAL